MKKGVSQNNTYIVQLLGGQRQWIVGHLYTFTNYLGGTDYFTDMDHDIGYQGINYKSGGLRIEGLKMKLGVGANVDEQEVTIWASPTDTLFGAAFLTGMADGIMDGGTISRQRIVWTPVTGNNLNDIAQPPAAVWETFLGYMSSIDKIGRTSVKFKVKSALVLLNLDMPRNFFQPGCLWNLFDYSVTTGQQGIGGNPNDGCTLLASNYAINGTVLDATIQAIAPVGGISPVTGADGFPNFQSGKLIFTSGVNDGLLVKVSSNDSTFLYLQYALEDISSPGDTFKYYPGCSKQYSTCQAKFNNTQNFRAFDKVPPVFVSI
jgi:Phage conserved hypothetical protein BR0599/Uncharacterized conserved protein (DUF2163)